MPPPNPLSIATSSLARLIREEASYHKEQEQQEAAITKLESQSEDKENEGEEGNRKFTLTQQVCVYSFPSSFKSYFNRRNDLRKKASSYTFTMIQLHSPVLPASGATSPIAYRKPYSSLI